MDYSLPNGTHNPDAIPRGLPDLPSLEQLEHELPSVTDGQVPLGELVSRVAQAIYAELTELAETMPHMPDIQRKRTLAEWVVKTKKQVVKLYAVAKWSRDANVVQKAMNITGFLMDQNRQFEDVINSLRNAKDSLDSARLRNHDLLTSLDVLTTGSYRRLPSSIKKLVIPPTPLTTDQVNQTLADVEDAMRYRLRMHELIPREMSQYRIADGRAHFIAPKLFEVSVCLLGAKREDGWFFVDVEFLFTVGGDVTGMQDFPRRPSGLLKRHITEEADARLSFYLPQPELPPDAIVPETTRPQLPEGVVDAPLVRLFNFLQMMSLSYQLEILWYQAERMRSLGWGEYLKVEMSGDRKTLTLTYWLRKPPQQTQRANMPKIPLFGGTLTISIIPTQRAPPLPTQPSSSARPSQSQTLPSQSSHASLRPSQSQRDHASQQGAPAAAPVDGRYRRSPKDRVLVELQERAKLSLAPKEQVRRVGKPSDEPEGMVMHVEWQPQPGALGVNIKAADMPISPEELVINPDDLDVEALLRKVIWVHSKNILRHFAMQLSWTQVFETTDEVVLDVDESSSHAALRVNLCPDETVIITLDPRTGRLNITGTGDLAAAGHGPRFSVVTYGINHNPTLLVDAVMNLRYRTIAELVEQKANYLGLQTFRQRPFRPDELKKLGQQRGMLYIQLSSFPMHYLVVVITDQDFRYALISAQIVPGTMYTEMLMGDIGWLDVSRIHGGDLVMPHQVSGAGQGADSVTNGVGTSRGPARFRLETQVLRELYAYCCARVAYTKVEQQLKSRGIPYKHVNPSLGPDVSPALTHLHSTLARSIPALCVQSSDILSGAPAAEAAMPNIRVIPLNWWADQKVQVVTCVKLKYVQQPVGKRAGSGAVIRPSKRIIYDTREALVTFVSEDVDKCVDEFLEEWARVSKMVVIAREVAQMSAKKKWGDVRLLSFDLQTVEFAYAEDYTVSITCTDQLAPTGGSYDLRFSRANDAAAMDTDSDDVETILSQYNPHEDVEQFMVNLLRSGPLSVSLPKVVAMLRDTLPIVAELEYIRVTAQKAGENIDAFAKTAGWFRVLYGDFSGDFRHALDFRLMAGARVCILDASNTLFPVDDRPALHMSPPVESELLLRPIPDFGALVTDACRAVAGTVGRTQVAPVNVGVVCDGTAVRTVARALHERVLRRLRDGAVKAEPAP